MLNAADIRRKYVEFFESRQHTHVASSPIVPPDDPTLMFTSAGMVQFKALYSGAVALPYRRAVTVQKCLRAGGKGSDLENVGVTLRHHTFFEMLGNFSFGDYFKREAIRWAWAFCTDPQWLGLPPERLWPTVYGEQDAEGRWLEVDEEAETIWREETGAVHPILRLGAAENYWGPAGETGACGPCSEIKFFMGTDQELQRYREMARSGRPEDLAQVRHDNVELGDLFLEIWNLVFPQFDQQPDGSRPPLKNRGIDTGMGLERTTTAVQFLATDGRIRTPYESDLLRPMVDAVSAASGLPYPIVAGDARAEATLREAGLDPAEARLAMNACADHVRALVFTLAEGLVPSNEGRGYVLRRILRRAARFGKKLGISEPFIWRLVRPTVEIMGEVYPEIGKHVGVTEKTIRVEEERFNRTLNQGTEILEQMLAEKENGGQLSGEEAHRLYDTFGFPLDLTIEAAAERGVTVDEEGFQKTLAASKQRARASWKGGAGQARWVELLRDLGEDQQTAFIGYEEMAGEATVLALIHGQGRADRMEKGQAGAVVLDRTPFYAEAGGQVGDCGVLTDADGAVLFQIEDTQKTENGFFLHFGEAVGPLEAGQPVTANVDTARRLATMRNHSVTHLMQGALKELLGGHVTQQGSFVGPEGLRFDFTNPDPVGEDTLREIEAIVNQQIRRDMTVTKKTMKLEEARAEGAIAPFGEKYGATVRVVTMGDYSKEFCGGTHVDRTGQIGPFVITAESSVAAGIRRVEAKTGAGAFDHITRERMILNNLSRRLSAPTEALEERVGGLQDEIKGLRRQLQEARAEQARAQTAQSLAAGREVAGVRLVHQEIPEANHQMLAQAWDAAAEKARENTIGLFYSTGSGKVNLVVGVTPDLAPGRIKAGDILKQAAAVIGGKGGGKPTLARGGGSQPEQVGLMIERLPAIIEQLLA